ERFAPWMLKQVQRGDKGRAKTSVMLNSFQHPWRSRRGGYAVGEYVGPLRLRGTPVAAVTPWSLASALDAETSSA
ncbi:MAG TPA: hypothetical protein VF695_14130, partial [Sphingomonas sp.]